MTKGPEFDFGYRERAQLGFIVLATERTIEREMVRLAPPGVGVAFARVPMDAAVTVETLRDVEPGLRQAASTLLPDDPPDVISYACTSGSLVLGEDVVMARIEEGAPSSKATTLITAVKRALRALGVTRVAVATPYVQEIDRLEAAHLDQSGFQVTGIRGLGVVHDRDISRISPSYLRDFVLETDVDGADGVFVSCGALRTLDLIEELEARLARPVVTSNQALMWDALRLAGIRDRLPGCGTLGELH